MKADLHVHSRYSDGACSLEEVFQVAARKGLTHLSVVDHDTTKGGEAAEALGEKHGIKTIRGIEISAYDFMRNRKVHILGYSFNKDAKHIRALCDPLLARRHENSLWQIEQLQRHHYAIELEEVEKIAAVSGVIYKQHIMECLLGEPYHTPSYTKLYKKLFKGDGICAKDIEYVDAIEAVKAIKADNGFAVLAHPGQLDSFELIPNLLKNGLDGIERNHFDHTADDCIKVERYALEYGLFKTGGSDFHGSFGRPIEVGDITSPTVFQDAVPVTL